MNNNNQSPESNNENLVEDLKESIKNTINETRYILEDLEQTVETTIKDKSIYDETKTIVKSISDEINNLTTKESIETLKANDHPKGFNNLEEE